MESFGGEIGAEIGLQRNLTMTSQNAWRVCTWKLELPPTGAGGGSGPRGVAMTYCKRGSACMDRTRRYLTCTVCTCSLCIRYGVHYSGTFLVTNHMDGGVAAKDGQLLWNPTLPTVSNIKKIRYGSHGSGVARIGCLFVRFCRIKRG